MNRRWFPFLALAFLAACQDQPTQPDAIKPQFDEEHHDEGEDDSHFGPIHKGSHLRLGHLYWKKIGPNTVEFTFIMGVRRSAAGSGANLGGVSNLASISMGDNTNKTP